MDRSIRRTGPAECEIPVEHVSVCRSLISFGPPPLLSEGETAKSVPNPRRHMVECQVGRNKAALSVEGAGGVGELGQLDRD